MHKIFFRFAIGILLFVFFPLLLCSGYLNYNDSPWEIVRGKDKVHRLELEFYPDHPSIYIVPNNKDEIFLSDVLPDYPNGPVYVWTPKGKKAGKYVWKVNINTFATEPILFEKFRVSNPQSQGKVWKNVNLSKFPSLQFTGNLRVGLKPPESGGYKIDANAPLSELISPEINYFKNTDIKYVVAISFSKLKILERKQYFTGLEYLPFSSEMTGWNIVQYYSGKVHLEFFELFNPKPIVHLQKNFNNWTVLPSIGYFGELGLLPSSKPCFILYDPYKLSQEKNFDLIIL